MSHSSLCSCHCLKSDSETTLVITDRIVLYSPEPDKYFWWAILPADIIYIGIGINVAWYACTL